MAELIPANWRKSVQRLREEISSAFTRWLAKFKNKEPENGDLRAPSKWAPMKLGIAVDETDDEIIVRAGLPGLGLSKKDVNVELTEERLVIRGGKESSRRSRHGYEESRAAFAHAVSLPCEVVPEKAKAKLKNGCLTVILPKNEGAKSRTIKIQAL